MWLFKKRPKILKKREPKPLQEVMTEAWLIDEKNIVTGLPYAEAVKHGCCGQGEIRAEYKILKKIFGKPSCDYGHKTDGKTRKEWIIKIDGVVCTIYDWKQGKHYRGYRPLSRATWSVGGSHPISRRLVQGVIDAYMIEKGLI